MVSCVVGVVFMFEHQDVPIRTPSIIVSPSTIDKMFEIYTFFENRTEIYTFFENRFEIYTCILFENRTENFEHFVNGRWTQY